MLRQLLISLIVVSLAFTIAHGQVWKTPGFDSTQHFVKGIYFKIKDSTAGAKALFCKIQYIKEISTQWDFSTKKWKTVSWFLNKLDPEISPPDVTKIDSIFLEDSNYIEECILCANCSGPYKTFLEWTEIKKELQHPSVFCYYYFQIRIRNQQGQEQELYFQIL